MTEGINKYLLPVILITILLKCSSCNSDVVFSDAMTCENNTWKLMNTADFIVGVDDTVNSNNVSFTLRTGSDYPYRNIWLFVRTISPDGKIIGDTLQYFVMDEKGNRLGKGFGDIRELILPYKSNVYFPLKGNYRFTIQHGMRSEDLEGIYDVGLRVSKIIK